MLHRSLKNTGVHVLQKEATLWFFSVYLVSKQTNIPNSSTYTKFLYKNNYYYVYIASHRQIDESVTSQLCIVGEDWFKTIISF